MLFDIHIDKELIKINFKSNKADKVKFNDDCFVKNTNYEYDFTAKNLNNIFQDILLIDGTVKQSFKKNSYYLWKIDLSEYPFVKSNFKSLIPKIIKKVYLKNILLDFQKVGSKWLLKDNNRILADDMGLGKSIQAISALEKLIFTNKLSSIIIFCPNTLVKNWSTEIIKWCPLLYSKELTSSDLNNDQSFFNLLYSRNILIISYSLLNKMVKLKGIKNYIFDIIIADEAHKLRNHTSIINKSFLKLNKNTTWLLTGTPFERDPNDIKNILQCLNKRIFSHDRYTSELIIRSRLELNSLRRIKKEVLSNLPILEHIVEEIDMEEEQKLKYDNLLKTMAKTLSVKRIGFFSQLSIAATCTDNGSSNKLQRATEICKKLATKNKKLIIFSNYNKPLKILQNRLSKIKINSLFLHGQVDFYDRHRIIHRFRNKNDVTCLLCNAKIGSEGLTLTESSTIIFLNEWWNPSSNRQAEDRINRIGQKDKMTIYLLRSKNTIDTHVAEILKNKNILEKDFLDILSKRILS